MTPELQKLLFHASRVVRGTPKPEVLKEQSLGYKMAIYGRAHQNVSTCFCCGTPFAYDMPNTPLLKRFGRAQIRPPQSLRLLLLQVVLYGLRSKRNYCSLLLGS